MLSMTWTAKLDEAPSPPTSAPRRAGRCRRHRDRLCVPRADHARRPHRLRLHVRHEHAAEPPQGRPRRRAQGSPGRRRRRRALQQPRPQGERAPPGRPRGRRPLRAEGRQQRLRRHLRAAAGRPGRQALVQGGRRRQRHHLAGRAETHRDRDRRDRVALAARRRPQGAASAPAHPWHAARRPAGCAGPLQRRARAGPGRAGRQRRAGRHRRRLRHPCGPVVQQAADPARRRARALRPAGHVRVRGNGAGGCGLRARHAQHRPTCLRAGRPQPPLQLLLHSCRDCPAHPVRHDEPRRRAGERQRLVAQLPAGRESSVLRRLGHGQRHPATRRPAAAGEPARGRHGPGARYVHRHHPAADHAVRPGRRGGSEGCVLTAPAARARPLQADAAAGPAQALPGSSGAPRTGRPAGGWSQARSRCSASRCRCSRHGGWQPCSA